MKFQQVIEAHILDSAVKSAKSLTSLVDNIKGKKHAASIIQSYLSGIGAGSGKSVHQYGNEIQSLLSAVNLYLEGDERMKNLAKEEYDKIMNKILKRMYR